ncbi:hypothetical protein [uncultured Arcticibacterium sp.]|uniref:hypothetical protein n=1 Tax=uncultured Arcticibacterium sp. TaxID=2173042 RepID=UPI0030FAE026
MNIIKTIVFFILTCQSFSVLAVTKTYVGASGGDWGVAASWTPAGIPGPSDYAIIPAGITVTVSGNQTGTHVGFIEIRGTLDLTNNGKLTVVDGVHIVSGGGAVGNGNSDQLRVNNITYSGNEITAIPEGTTGNSGAYPVTLAGFELYVQGESVQLKWQTSEELNFSKFEVEKSSNAVSFERIGNQNSLGIQIYSFVDENPFVGNNYYRLKMVDLDGTFDYSKIITINYEGEDALIVYPNPSESSVINVSGLYDSEEVMLYRLNGQRVEFDFLESNNGQLQITPKEKVKAETLILRSNLNRSTRVFTF